MVAVVETRGRKAKFSSSAKKQIVKLVQKLGLTGTRRYLNENGIRNGGREKELIEVSLTTLSNIAGAAGVELTRGRPTDKPKAAKVTQHVSTHDVMIGKKRGAIPEVSAKKRGRRRKMHSLSYVSNYSDVGMVETLYPTAEGFVDEVVADQLDLIGTISAG